MPRALFTALVVSSLLHGALLIFPVFDLSVPSQVPEPMVLQASLVPAAGNTEISQAPEPVPPRVAPRPPKPRPVPRPVKPVQIPSENPAPESVEAVLPSGTEIQEIQDAQESQETPAGTSQGENVAERVSSVSGAQAEFPPQGEIRYVVYQGDMGLEIGYSIHRWKIEEGRYVLKSITETSGLAALLRPVRMEVESKGTLGPRGFVPEAYRVFKNGKPSGEWADFDWANKELRTGKKQVSYPLKAGSQDLLSLHYQLAYLPHLDEGVSLRVATGKKYELFDLDVVGEELLELPAGNFRALHLRYLTETRTELWLALDHLLLPLKVRYTDKKGNAFEQLAREIRLGSIAPDPNPEISDTNGKL